jgi:hypothetical protein
MAQDVRQRSFSAGEISPRLYGRTDSPSYGEGLKQCRNMIPLAEGPIRNRPGTVYVAAQKDQTERARLVLFEGTNGINYLLEFGAGYIRFYNASTMVRVVITGSGTSAGDLVYTGITDAQMRRMRFAQKGDVLWFTSPNVGIGTITRTGAAAFDLLFHYATIPPTRAIAVPTTVVAAAGSVGAGDPDHPDKAWQWAVTAIDVNGVESYPTLSNVYTAALYPDRAAVTVTTTGPAAVVAHVVYRGRNGVYGFVGSMTPTATVSVFLDDGFDPDFTHQPPLGQWPFASTGSPNKGLPSCITFFEGRIVFARTNNTPGGIWAGKIGDDFNFDIYIPIGDSNSLAFILSAARMEEVRALVPLRNLVILGKNAEWVANPTGEPVTPFAFTPRPHSHHGSSWVDPVVLGDLAVFIQERGNVVRVLGFSNEAQGLVDTNASRMSQHLLDESPIHYMATAGAPNNVVWMIREDGILLGLSLSREPESVGWHWHETDGLFEAVCAVPTGYEDDIFVTVKRTINGVPKRYIEKFASRNVTEVDDFIFLDAAVTKQMGVGVITGLAHLEGEVVYALVDGVVAGPFTVGSGQIDLAIATEGAWDSAITYAPGLYVTRTGQTYVSLQVLDDDDAVVANLNKDPATDEDHWKVATVHIGLPYTSEMELLDLAPQKTAVKTVRKVGVEVESSRGVWMGEDIDHLRDASDRSVTDSYGAPAAFTGVIVAPISSTWNKGGRIILQQRDPLPITVLGVTREVEGGGS